MSKRVRYEGECRIERAIRVFGGKWKPAIMYYLSVKGTLRFSELRRLIPEVSQRMLTQQLRDMERDGLIVRKQFAEIPPRVEYSRTALAESLSDISFQIHEWAEANMDAVDQAQHEYDARVGS
jgi:DNA-binding HxlR family transcriptional regulator